MIGLEDNNFSIISQSVFQMLVLEPPNNNDRLEEVAQLENNNNMKLIDRMCDSCDIEFQTSKALSRKPQNPLNIFCDKCYADLMENNDNLRDDVKYLRKMESKR